MPSTITSALSKLNREMSPPRWPTCGDLSGWRPPFFRVADDPLGAVAKHCAVTREHS